MDCYIWSSSNQWEGFTAPSGSYLHSVKVPGWGIWYYNQDLSTTVLLDETTGNWDTSLSTQWSNQRNISSSCVVQISATQTATIGDVRFHLLRPLPRSAHQTPNFTNLEFKFPQFKVLQSGFFLI